MEDAREKLRCSQFAIQGDIPYTASDRMEDMNIGMFVHMTDPPTIYRKNRDNSCDKLYELQLTGERSTWYTMIKEGSDDLYGNF